MVYLIWLDPHSWWSHISYCHCNDWNWLG